MSPDQDTEPDDQAIEDQQIENDIEDAEEARLEAAEEERQMELELERMERGERELIEAGLEEDAEECDDSGDE